MSGSGPNPPGGGPAKVRVQVRPARPPDPSLDERWAAFRTELAAQVETFQPVADVIGGRIMLLRYVRQLVGRTPAQREQGLTRLRPDHRQMAETILHQVNIDAMLERRLTIAVQRFDMLSVVLQDARAALAQGDEGSPAVRAAIMGRIDLPKQKGQLYLLTTYDQMFRDDPVLNQIFPPVPRKPMLGQAAPPKPRRPPATEPVPEPTPASSPDAPRPPPSALQLLLRKLDRLLEEARAGPGA